MGTHIEITLSPYKFWWIEFRAIKGIALQKDAKILTGQKFYYINKQKQVLRHFSTLERAKEYLSANALRFSKLNKQYEVRLCTDKQMSLSYRDWDKGMLIIPYTKKQESEMFIIGKP